VSTARPESLNLVRAVDPWQLGELARGTQRTLDGPPSRVRRSHQKPRTSPRLLARSDTRPSSSPPADPTGWPRRHRQPARRPAIRRARSAGRAK
jgi:hypothetical protein